MEKRFTYNKEIGGSHKSAAVYVETVIHDDMYIEQWVKIVVWNLKSICYSMLMPKPKMRRSNSLVKIVAQKKNTVVPFILLETVDHLLDYGHPNLNNN